MRTAAAHVRARRMRMAAAVRGAVAAVARIRERRGVGQAPEHFQLGLAVRGVPLGGVCCDGFGAGEGGGAAGGAFVVGAVVFGIVVAEGAVLARIVGAGGGRVDVLGVWADDGFVVLALACG